MALPTGPTPITVQPGDTLAGLGQDHGFDWRQAQIRRDGQTYAIGDNGIRPEHLRPGDEIVPGGQASPIDRIVQNIEETASDRDVEAYCQECLECDHPVWLETAKAELGVLEIVGSSGSTPRVEEYLRSTDIASSYHDDDTHGALLSLTGLWKIQ